MKTNLSDMYVDEISGILKIDVISCCHNQFVYLPFLLSVILNRIFQIDQVLKNPSASFECH